MVLELTFDLHEKEKETEGEREGGRDRDRDTGRSTVVFSIFLTVHPCCDLV